MAEICLETRLIGYQVMVGIPITYSTKAPDIYVGEKPIHNEYRVDSTQQTIWKTTIF